MSLTTGSIPGYIKPVRKGIYYRFLPKLKVWVRQYFDGYNWLCNGLEDSYPSMHQSLTWFGLTIDGYTEVLAKLKKKKK